jgi:hypothetical protein
MGTASATLLTAPLFGPRVTRTTGASSSNSCLSMGSVDLLEVAPRLLVLAPRNPVCCATAERSMR